MASLNTKNLYAHYLTVPHKKKQAEELLKKFPELAEKPEVEEEPVKEEKSNGKRPKR